jgi:hypothetical protein
MSMSMVCGTLRLDRKTVQRFARTATVGELLATPPVSPNRPSLSATAAATRPHALTATIPDHARRTSCETDPTDRPERQQLADLLP